jgi:hypothetical protein
MNSLNLKNVISTGENTFIARMSLSELKNIIDFDAIEINCEKDVPYVPLENESIIYLNIDKKNAYYNKQTNVLNVNDKFRVLDGEIRLINFIKHYDSDYSNLNDIVTINIVCCDIYTARKTFLEVNEIPVNTESIKEIAHSIMNPFEEVQELISKIRELSDTITGRRRIF